MVVWKVFIEIQKLRESGFKKSAVARRLNLDRKTVDKYWDLELDEFAQVINQAQSRQRKLNMYENVIVEWLREHEDITAAQIEDWLKELYNDHSIKERTLRSYVAYLRDKHEIPKRTNPRQYQAVEDPPMGFQMQLDFGEKKVMTDTKSQKKLYALGSVLSNSRQKYGEWSERPLTTQSLIEMLINCFNFYEGVPQEVVIDQDKLMVVSENHGDIIYTHMFEQFRRKMGFKLRVCRAADPESKGRVEAVVKYLKYGFAANRTFTNIATWNQSCADWLDRTANKKVHGTTKKTPAEVFALEKQYLRPVPSLWLLPTDSVTRMVRKDNTVIYKSNRYTVPIGTYAPGVEIQVTEMNSKLTFTDMKTKQEIAVHQLSTEKGSLIQNRNHLRNYDSSIAELYQNVLQTLEYIPNLSNFLDIIREIKGRYIRDQYRLILSLHDSYSPTILLQAFDFCQKNELYSAVSLRDVAEHFAHTQEVATTSEFNNTSVLPEYLRIQATVRDINEYVNLQMAGDVK